MSNLADGKRNKILLLQASYTDNGQGGKTPTYSTFAEVWGKVEEEPGQEEYFSGQTYGIGKAKITIRYLPGVTRAMQAQNGNKIYRIEAIRDKQVGWKRELELMCNEYQPKATP